MGDIIILYNLKVKGKKGHREKKSYGNSLWRSDTHYHCFFFNKWIIATIKTGLEEMGAIDWMLQVFFLFLLARQSFSCSSCSRCCVSFQLLFSLLQEDSVFLCWQTEEKRQKWCIRSNSDLFKGVFPLIHPVKRVIFSVHDTTVSTALLHSLLDFWTDRTGRPKTRSSPWHLQCMPWCVDGIINC